MEDPSMEKAREVARLLDQARPTAGAAPKTGGPSDKSYELYRETGENFRSVRVGVSGEDFQIDTHDMGRATEEFWGDSDYEFWTIVNRAEWPKLLAAFAKEVGAEAWASDPETWRPIGGAKQAKLLLEVSRTFFADDSKATDRFADICKKHEVEYNGGSWV